MNITKAIVIGCLISLFVTMIVHCTVNVFAAENTNEAFEIPGECAKREDKCSIAYTVRWHEAFEKDAIGYTKGAIWWFDGKKYPAKKAKNK